MCFGGGQKQLAAAQNEQNVLMQEMLNQQQDASNKATQQADAAAAKAQQNIASDQAAVNQAFQQFTPDYYQNYVNDYTNYYTPQLENQYKLAQDQLTAALSGNGTLESTVGANALAQLAQRNADQEAAIQQQGAAAGQSLQGNVANQRATLLGQANATTDPTQIAANAQAATTALAAPPTYQPLGNIFSDLVTPFGNYVKGAAQQAATNGSVLPNVVTPNAYNQGSGGTASPY